MHADQIAADLTPASEVRAELARQIAAAGGVVAWARRAGLSHAAVSFALNGARPITERVANAAGYSVTTVYRRIARGGWGMSDDQRPVKGFWADVLLGAVLLAIFVLVGAGTYAALELGFEISRGLCK